MRFVLLFLTLFVIVIPTVHEQLITQINYYFSRKNISSDVYLVSHMNNELFVAISVVANFAKIKALTEDLGILVDAMKASDQVVVDETTMRVRPVFRLQRNTLILRNIPSDADIEIVAQLLSAPGIPKIATIRPDIGNNWFITMDTEEDTLAMFAFARGLTWDGTQIAVRIKSENLLKSVHEREAQLEPNQEAAKADIKLPPGYIPPSAAPTSVEMSLDGSQSGVFSPNGAHIPPQGSFFYPHTGIGPNGEVMFPPAGYPYIPEYGGVPSNSTRYYQQGYPSMMNPYGHNNGAQWRPNSRRPYNGSNQQSMMSGYSNNNTQNGANRYNNNRPRGSVRPEGDHPKEAITVNSEEHVVPIEATSEPRRQNSSGEQSGAPSYYQRSNNSTNFNNQGIQRNNRGSTNYTSGQSQQIGHHGSSRSNHINNRGQRPGHNGPQSQRRSSQTSHAPYNPDNFPALSPSPQPSQTSFAPTKAYSVVAAESASREQSPLMTTAVTNNVPTTFKKAVTKKSTSSVTGSSSASVSKKTTPAIVNMAQDEMSLVADLLPAVTTLKISSTSDASAGEEQMASSPAKTFSYAEALRKANVKKEDAVSTTTSTPSPSATAFPSKEIRA